MTRNVIQLIKLSLLLTTIQSINSVVDIGKPGDSLFYGEADEPNFLIRWQYQYFCDHVYDPHKSANIWPTDKENGVVIDPADVKSGDIIFVRMIPDFFKYMNPEIKHPYIIVTAGEQFDRMKDEYEEYLNDPKVIAWFGVHPTAMAMSHPKFHPLPLGIYQKPDHYHDRVSLNEFFKMLRKNCEKRNLVYLNFRDQKISERIWVRELFKDEPYVKCCGQIPFHQCLEQTAQSCFTLSPIGNAPDCYRTWETLLCGSIPIIKHSFLDKLFEGLPVLIVEDWDIIDEAYLREKYIEITSQKYDLKRLYANYWTDQIRIIQQAYRRKSNEADCLNNSLSH